MHIEFLVEDLSGRKALDNLVPRIIAGEHSFRLHHYKGIGHIPKGLKDAADPLKRLLLGKLPGLLRGYGRTPSVDIVIVVCDLDRKIRQTFHDELNAVLDACLPRPTAVFCLAVEEAEAWLLGYLPAVYAAYPKARNKILTLYENDSICGTWELLADAIFPGGSKKLVASGPKAVGAEKYRWAETIAPGIDVELNCSPSFCTFRDTLRLLTST